MNTEPGAMAQGRAGVRASDAEREEYARIVRDAVGEGRLTLGEGDERLATIYQATHRDDLRPLISDLPADLPGERPDSRGYGRPGLAWHGDGRPGHGRPAFDRPDIDRRRGQPPWPPGRAFARHAGFVLVVAAVLVGIWSATGSHFFWPAIPLTFLALGLVRHRRWRGTP